MTKYEWIITFAVDDMHKINGVAQYKLITWPACKSSIGMSDFQFQTMGNITWKREMRRW